MKKITVEEIDEVLIKLRTFIESEACSLTFEEFKKRFTEQVDELEKLLEG